MIFVSLLVRGAVLLAASAGALGSLKGCDSRGGKSSATTTNGIPDFTAVTIDGTTFNLEVVATDEKRFKGLSGRTEIPDKGGMIFVFTNADQRYFVMRDCPIAIDIIFLDAAMKVTAMHAMTPEPPRSDAEKVIDPRIQSNQQYEERLKKYHSRFPAQYVIELKAGTLPGLGLKEGQKIDIDPLLKKVAK